VENFNRIRRNLDAIEIHHTSIEQVLEKLEPGSLNACNLSDIFEYMSAAGFEKLLRSLVRSSAEGCRLVYWNVVVSRSRPAALADLLKPLSRLSRRLHSEDKAFFYRDLVVEEVS
jgi:S-adenosylmethionine-diacylglycerol 3-amino-3-carboxypropyl transferase